MRRPAAEKAADNNWGDDWTTPIAAAPSATFPTAAAAAQPQPYVYATPAAVPAPPSRQPFVYQPVQQPARPAPSQPGGAFSYQPSVGAAPTGSFTQPIQPMQPMLPVLAPVPQAPTGYKGNIFVPGQSSGGGGSGSGEGMEAVAADAVAKVQQMAAGMALNYMMPGGGNQNLETSIAAGANQLTGAAASFTGSRLAVLRYYFDVNNAYVLKKLQILLLPFRHAQWERMADGTSLRPPSQDPNAPDLYLPLMSLVTYILVAGFVSGADGRFTPEVLASTASTGLAIVLLEVILIKLGLYLLQSEGGTVPMLELASCSGYKFVAAVIVLLTKTVGGTLAGYVAIALAGLSIGTFMTKTIQQCLVQGSGYSHGFIMADGMGSPGRSERRKKQFYSLLVIGLLQPFFFWYLSLV